MPAIIRAHAACLLLVAVLAAFSAGACSRKKRAATPPRPLVSTTTTTAAVTTTAPLVTTVPPTVLAGVEGDLPGIRLELNSLERLSDEVVRLTFTLVNTGTNVFTFADNFGSAGSVDGITIVDTANEQNLPTLTEGPGSCRCSQGLSTLAPGQRLSLFSELSAPPADIGLVSVVVPHFPGVQRIHMS